ncbi:universal stress protein [Pseudomonas sp. H9]|uniref:universal stress protein n=1 Tax=Pseudomonas sp. H9 TaxID=483968 RepID=UPI001057CA37|nr:universal stress protein [Pseudomonas sp. H9]TDF86282.1 universal stress protein UspA [Pseudomonas sp. H9]
MHTIRNTLVVVDAQQPGEMILHRAKMIASATRSHLHLLACNKGNHHSPYLHDLQTSLQQQGYSVSTQQAWHGSEHRTIITVQQAKECGLVIKQHFTDNPVKKAFLTPEDWKLLRYCPSPVLMVKTERPWTDGTILAAVDIGNSDVEHRVLHSGIVSHGYDIAKLAGGTLHMMSAHPYPMLSASDPIFQLKESIQAFYRDQCKRFQAEFHISDERLHIVEGPPEVLIPYHVHKLEAALTVVGSVARTGLNGALIGNTAEMLLDTLDSDILVLKPNDVILHLEELAAPPASPSVDTAIISWPYSHHSHRVEPEVSHQISRLSAQRAKVRR